MSGHAPHIGSLANVPEKFLTWRWEDKELETRYSYTPDSKKPDAGTFVLAKEDHTMGNLIRMQLLRDPAVRFAGYRIPHPLIYECHIRVETMDSKLTPPKVNLQVHFALSSLI
jgi:DNA-directed RNA polymerase II subunit RPB11